MYSSASFSSWRIFSALASAIQFESYLPLLLSRMTFQPVNHPLWWCLGRTPLSHHFSHTCYLSGGTGVCQGLFFSDYKVLMPSSVLHFVTPSAYPTIFSSIYTLVFPRIALYFRYIFSWRNTVIFFKTLTKISRIFITTFFSHIWNLILIWIYYGQ